MSKHDFVMIMDYARGMPGFDEMNYADSVSWQTFFLLKNATSIFQVFCYRLVCAVDFVINSAYYTYKLVQIWKINLKIEFLQTRNRAQRARPERWYLYPNGAHTIDRLRGECKSAVSKSGRSYEVSNSDASHPSSVGNLRAVCSTCSVPWGILSAESDLCLACL